MIGLSAENLAIGYHGAAIAAGIDLAIEPGTVTGLLGPNGAGKSTLLKTLLGTIPAIGGTIRIGADELVRLSRIELARRVAYVPQSYSGDFAYTVLDLVLMGRTAHLRPLQTPRMADLEVARAALETLGIGGLAERDMRLVSGGQRQLALIARALAQEAPIILMDEPTASLDLGNRLRVLDRIRQMAADGLAILFSTHEPDHVFAIADHVAVLSNTSGFRVGPPAKILSPELLSDLYGAPLTIEVLRDGRRIVVPR